MRRRSLLPEAAVALAVLAVVMLPILRPRQTDPILGDRTHDLRLETRPGRARLSKLSSLRTLPMGRDDFEVRIWQQPASAPPCALLFRRKGRAWSGERIVRVRRPFPGELNDPIIRTKSQGLSRQRYRARIASPVSGPDLWADLTKAGILTLPGDRRPLDDALPLAGITYTVEINQGGDYRCMTRALPADRRRPETKQLVKILKLLEAEFGPLWDGSEVPAPVVDLPKGVR